jgi:hypothetical protein
MNKINDNFCGYAYIGENDYAFYVSGHLVKLLPPQKGFIELKGVDRNPLFVYGVDENNNNIAFQRNTRDYVAIPYDPHIFTFGTPIIIQSTNLSDYVQELRGDWDKFDALEFRGEIIDKLYNPKCAVVEEKYEYKLPYDGAETIKLKASNEYTYKCDVKINNTNAKLIMSICSDHGWLRHKNGSLGNLSSFIQLEFENEQRFDKLEEYYVSIYKMLSILSLSRNIEIKCSLLRKLDNNELDVTAICKVYHPYTEYTNKSAGQMITLNESNNFIPQLLSKINSNYVDSILELLPDHNKPTINIVDIQNLCTALEVAYEKSKYKHEQDACISALREEINECLDKFMKSCLNLDVGKQTTIKSAFEYLDWTARNKIEYMYRRREEIIAKITRRDDADYIYMFGIPSLLRMRNKKTHRAIVEWNGGSKLFTPMLALLYIILFESLEIDKDGIIRLFASIFKFR